MPSGPRAPRGATRPAGGGLGTGPLARFAAPRVRPVAGEMRTEVMLDLLHLFVVVRPCQRQQNIAGLARSRHVGKQRLEAPDRHLATAKPIHRVQARIARGIHAAAAAEPGILGEGIRREECHANSQASTRLRGRPRSAPWTATGNHGPQGGHVAVRGLRPARLQHVMLGSVRLRVCWEGLDARQQILAQAEDVAIVGLLDGRFSEVEALKTGEVRRLGLAEPFWRRVTILADHVRPCLAMPRCDGAIERPFLSDRPRSGLRTHRSAAFSPW